MRNRYNVKFEKVEFLEPKSKDNEEIDIYALFNESREEKKQNDDLGDLESSLCGPQDDDDFVPQCFLDLLPSLNELDPNNVSNGESVFMCDHDEKSGLRAFKCNKCNGFWCKKCLMNKFNYTKAKISKLSLKKDIFECPKCVLKAIDDKKRWSTKEQEKKRT